ncbi:MAG: DUF2628 domain-containing protein [Bacillus sp. (in: Bacteria)]|nr:DUF2628 domain-containing protein [Bacillus sp. (in: firmicutes)]
MSGNEFQTKVANDPIFEHQLEEKIQHNTNYYISKWKDASEPFNFSGWNWPAFLITPFWLSYRQMYRHLITYSLFLLAIFSLSLSIPLFLYFTPLQELNQIFWTSTAIVLIHLYYGFKGNAVYAKFIASLFQWEASERKTNVPLFNRTGRSWISAIIAPIFMIVFIAIPLFWGNTFINTSTLPYGLYVYLEDQGAPQSVVEIMESESQVFQKYSSTIHLLYYSQEPINSQPFQIVLHYRENEQDDWTLLRDRTFSFFTSNKIELDLLNAEDPLTKTGEYQVEVFIDGEHKGITFFEIQL